MRSPGRADDCAGTGARGLDISAMRSQIEAAHSPTPDGAVVAFHSTRARSVIHHGGTLAGTEERTFDVAPLLMAAASRPRARGNGGTAHLFGLRSLRKRKLPPMSCSDVIGTTTGTPGVVSSTFGFPPDHVMRLMRCWIRQFPCTLTRRSS